MKRFFVLCCLLVLALPVFVYSTGNVIINEIAWMGTKESGNNEWIELANMASQEIDITGWHLDSVDGGLKITLAGKIPAGGFFLLERTNDATVPDINADQIYTGALSNASEVLILKDNQGQEVNRIDASKGWPAGDNTTKDTMQWVSGKWVSAKATPKAANASPAPQSVQGEASSSDQASSNSDNQSPKENTIATSTRNSAPPPQLQSAQVKEEPITKIIAKYPESLYISEFMPDPKGPDESGEWIELYNDADKQENIGGFFLDDAEGGSLPYGITKDTTIGPKGYLVFKRSDTKIALNNKHDEVRLLYPNKSIVASVSYDDAKEGQSAAYDFAQKRFTWTTKPTPGAPNIITSQTQLVSDPSAKLTYQEQNVRQAQDVNLPNTDGSHDSKKQNTLPTSASSEGSLNDFWVLLIALVIGAGATLGYLTFFRKVKLWLVVFFLVLALPLFSHAETFYITPELDAQGRSQIDADFVKSGNHSIFFTEHGIDFSQEALGVLSKEFEDTIYPRLTALLGDAFSSGIDHDSRVSILLSNMVSPIGGYFNGEDEVSTTIKPNSNQRAIVYLNLNFLTRYKIREFLAHEFTHIITFNQKVRRLGRMEETWLNEVRSEYASSYLGYDEKFPISNLKERYDDFLRNSYDHLITWNNTEADYAVVSMFGQYLAARFGPDFFAKEIRANNVGIASVDQTLQSVSPGLTFARFFSQWRLTNYVNDPTILEGNYSYKNKNITFTFTPEISLDIHSFDSAIKAITSSIPTFSGKAVSLNVEGNRAKIEISVVDPSRDLVVSYIEQRKDNTFRDGQFSLESGKGAILTDKDTVGIIAMVSNASSKIINTAFTITPQPRASVPAITLLEPVFLHPTPEQNAAIIKGKEFDAAATLYVNAQTQPFVFQNDETLITKLPLTQKIIEIKLVNPDGVEATYTWQNPFITPPALVMTQIGDSQTIPEGSLVRASNNSNVYLYQHGYRRFLASRKLLLFYKKQLRASSILVVSPEELATTPVSNLVRVKGGTKVYEILSNGKKRWIKTAQEFVQRGFDWKAIFEINRKELSFYPTI